MTKRMNISTSLNSKYMRYTYVMLTSLLGNQPKGLDIHVYLLHSDLTESDKEYLHNVVESFDGTLHLLQVDPSLFPKDCPITVNWSLEMYFRLMLPKLLPEDVDRILYIDVDTIVNHSLLELYDTDFEGNMLCACTDPLNGDFPDIRNEIFAEHMKQGFTYFNSGVLLMNVPAMREKYDLKDYLKVAEDLEYNILAPDQDLLNYVHWNEVKIMDANKYNLFARLAFNYDIHYEEVKEQVTIIHFTGRKPWSGTTLHFDIEQLWWDYAKKTPFYIELMEEFVHETVNDPTIFKVMEKLAQEKNALSEELNKSVAMCQKLLQMIQGK